MPLENNMLTVILNHQNETTCRERMTRVAALIACDIISLPTSLGTVYETINYCKREHCSKGAFTRPALFKLAATQRAGMDV